MTDMTENELIGTLIGKFRNVNAKYYLHGVPELPCRIEAAVNLGNGSFIVASYLMYSFERGRLIPVVPYRRTHEDVGFIRFEEEGPKFWTPHADSTGHWVEGLTHHCGWTVVTRDGQMIYPRYVMHFPIKRGGLLELHERLPIPHVRSGEAHITVDGRKLYDLDERTRSYLVAVSDGTAELGLAVGEEL